MKKLFLLSICFSFFFTSQAIDIRTTNITTAGTLSTVASSYLSTVTNLTITGSIDARDFKTMRDNMPLLNTLDISKVTIAAYQGTGGTGKSPVLVYPANEIPQWAFCYSIETGKSTLTTAIILPASVTSVGLRAFSSCTGLTGITFGNSLTNISDEAFSNCISLTGTLSIPATVTNIGHSAFWKCGKLSGNLIIGNHVTSIGSQAFQWCSGFNGDLIIGNSVNSIGDYAFEGCSNLKSINAKPFLPVNLVGNNFVFRYIPTNTCTLYVPVGRKLVYQAATKWNAFSNIIEDSIFTTLNKTLVPIPVNMFSKVSIDQDSLFEQYGYGHFSYGHGLDCQKRLDLMPKNYKEPTANDSAKRLARFFTITDIHITDKESPAQCIFFRNSKFDNAISVYAPLMLYTTQMLDATVQTINDIHKVDAFDFGIALGDLANSTQRNELRWFIDVLDGDSIRPYSGGRKDPIPGPNNDYQDPFLAKGLDKSIPWYATIGNHDHFFMGSKPIWSNPVNEKLRNAFVSDSILKLGNILSPLDPNAINENTYSMGTIDGRTRYGKIIGDGVVNDMKSIPTVTPDNNRRSLSKQEWMKEFSNTSSFPKGHGFNQKSINNNDTIAGCYSFMTNTKIPIKVIVLDDTQDDTDPPIVEGIYGHGSLSNGRYKWLKNQLKAGQDSNQLMIISAHVPIGVADNMSAFSWGETPEYKNDKDVIKQLKTYPNLILWVAGHRHLNTVTPLAADNGEPVQNSFWEVETKSLREFPEQFRTFDIKLNSDSTISIITTNVDPVIAPASQAAIGRSYAIASNQIYGIKEAPQPTGSVSYNAELVKLISPEMRRHLWKKLNSKNNK
jgi:metallophosphoesterase (TIGR03768 family)